VVDVSSISGFVTGKEFRRARRSAGYSQAQLSRELAITIRSLTRWETGETPVPKIAELALKYVVKEKRRKGKH
jgi:transcriptional regulator with XRE-family HTH domain